jgi:putative ABC transport system substrate-binding protein
VKISSVGILWHDKERSISPFFDVFRQSLSDAGYVEGRNLNFVHRWSEGRLVLLPDLVTDLVRLKVNVLFASQPAAFRAIAAARTKIPVVVISGGDLVDAGLVNSLARPGGNITGVSGRAEEVTEKLLELLIETRRGASRLAVMGGPLVVGLHRKSLEVAARSLGVRLQFLEVPSLKELDAAFAMAANEHAEGLLLLPTPFFSSNEMQIAELALQRRLPAIYWRSGFPEEAGGLMSYGPDRAY